MPAKSRPATKAAPKARPRPKAPPAQPPKFRSAVTGEYVTEAYALTHRNTTVRET